MIDRDIAVLYGVETRAINQAVKRNSERFPEDFMFQLTKEEAQNWMSQNMTSKNDSLRSQFVTLKRGQHIKHMPYAFTEQGVAMLSSVLNSRTALSYKDILLELERLEKKYNSQFQIVFKAIKLLLDDKNKGDHGNKRF